MCGLPTALAYDLRHARDRRDPAARVPDRTRFVNRERVIPALERLVGSGESPRSVGVLARRTMRGELGGDALCVRGDRGAHQLHAADLDAASGPFSTDTTIGSAVFEMAVEPARVGLNTVHLYLINAKSGAQFTATKELTVTARLPPRESARCR